MSTWTNPVFLNPDGTRRAPSWEELEEHRSAAIASLDQWLAEVRDNNAKNPPPQEL